MKTIKVRDLPFVNLSTLDNNGLVKLIYDDGTTETINFRLLWMDANYIRPMKGLPISITREMLYHSYYKGIYKVSDVYAAAKVMVRAISEYHMQNGTFDYVERTKLNKARTDCFGRAYNKFTYEEKQYFETFDVDDLMQITLHKDIVAYRNFIKAGNYEPQNISDFYALIEEVIRRPEFDNNELAMGHRRGEYKKDQFYQVVGARGHIADRNGVVYKYPIADSYGTGVSSMYDILADSNGTHIALDRSTFTIGTVSHLAKKMNIIASSVEYVERRDCGSKKRDRVLITSVKEYLGCAYDTPEGLKYIRETDEHLVGTIMDIRSPILCELENPHNVCECCLGEISVNLIDGRNIGSLFADNTTVSYRQSQLSGKHLLKSVSRAKIKLLNDLNNLLSVDGLKIVLNKEYDGYMRVPKTRFIGLHILNKDSNGEYIIDDIEHLSSTSTITINCEDKKTIHIGLSIDKDNDMKGGMSFSKEFILHALENVVYTYRYYLIPTPPAGMVIGTFKGKQSDLTSVVMKQVISELTKGSNNTPLEVTQSILEKLRLLGGGYYPYISTLVYAYSAISTDDGRLPRGVEGKMVGNSSIISNATYSQSLPNDRSLNYIYNLDMLDPSKKRSNISDGIVMPAETINARY